MCFYVLGHIYVSQWFYFVPIPTYTPIMVHVGNITSVLIWIYFNGRFLLYNDINILYI